MRNSRFFALLALTAPLLLFAAAASAQDVPLDLELGYQVLDVSGNEDMFRSQANEQEGVILRSLEYASYEKGPVIDNIRIEASELGVGPAGWFRIQTGQTKAWQLSLFYKRSELYSALPEFANPHAAHGMIPGQHTYDRERDTLGLDFELRRWKSFQPFVAWRYDRFRGPGSTTYHVGQDEFALDQDLKDVTEELRVGTGIELGFLSGEISQAWRTFNGSEGLSLADGAGGGNNAGTVLGTPVSLTSFERETRTKTSTPVTNGFLVARLGSRARVTASYTSSSADGETDQSEKLAGQLVSYQILRYFSGLSQFSSLEPERDFYRGSGRLDVDLLPGIGLTAGYARQRQESEGFGDISTLYLQTVAFGGGTPADLFTMLAASNSLDRRETIVDAGLNATIFGSLSFRISASKNSQEVTSEPDPSEIVVPNGQDGDFEREIDQLDAGASWTGFGLTLSADYRQERADEPVVRTDFLDRDRYRVRLGYTFRSLFRLSATGMQLDTANDRDGIGYDARIKQYGGSLDVTPFEDFELRLGGDKYQSDSTVSIRHPMDWEVGTSIHAEDGTSYEGGFRWKASILTLDASYSDFTNEGSFPFELSRARARAEFEITKNISAAGEFARDKYEEDSLHALGDYEADRWSVFLRWRQ